MWIKSVIALVAEGGIIAYPNARLIYAIKKQKAMGAHQPGYLAGCF